MKSSQRLFLGLRLLLACGLFGISGLADAAAPAAKPANGQKAAAAASKDPNGFIETVNVGVVNVDVYVTDKKGNPVSGLTEGDFQIFENGRPIEITNFYAVSGGKATTPPAELAAAAAAPPAAPEAGAPPPGVQDLDKVQTPEEQRLRLVVYIDNYNLQPFDRNRVMRELRAFIGNKLGRDDQLMLVTYDREVHVRRTFTSDPSLIAAAMLDLEKISAQGVHQQSDRRDFLQKIADSQSVTEADSYAYTHAQS